MLLTHPLRSSVVSLIKTSDVVFSERVSAIQTLDEKLSRWWRQVPPIFELTTSSVETISHDLLPKILLLNVVYHQSLCALHASIVPAFCWSPSDESWLLARQLAANVAYHHAREVSALIKAVLSEYPRLSAMPSFVAYAAYCGCAIQIPFIWCSNPIVRGRAQANVRSNITMIHTMAEYWKFSAILVWSTPLWRPNFQSIDFIV